MESAASTAVNSAPASFDEAFASDASPAAEPSQQSNDAAAAEQPTTEVVEAAPQQEGDTKRSPFIPRERFDEVNTQLAELRKWKEQYGWAEQMAAHRDAYDQAVRIGQLFNTDRAAFVRELLGDNPPPELISEFARTLAGRRGAQTAVEEPQPDLPIQLEDGRVVRLYSAEQQAKREAWLQQQWLGKVQEQMAPALTAAQKLQQAEEYAKRVADANTFATGFLGELSKKPHFAELRGEIFKRLGGVTLESDHPAEVRAAALEIYSQLFAEKVLPTLSQKAQSDLLDNLQQKAAASTSVNPGSAAPSTPRRYSSFDELPAEMWK